VPTLAGSPTATERPRRTLPPLLGTLTATRLKASLVLNTAELNAVPTPEGKPRITLRIRLPGRTPTADIATKSRARRNPRHDDPPRK
jgi:hypothetical protein